MLTTTAVLGTTSIVDNRNGNTLLAALKRIGEQGRTVRIAAAFFPLDALLLLADQLEQYEQIRILFGDDASPRQRRALLEMLRLASDRDLLAQRESGAPLLSALEKVRTLFAAGRVEARCYTAEKFHAKAYLVQRDVFPSQVGVLGSGNFTRPGLLQNVELNVLLSPEQTAHLDAWYEERWAEAAEDVVTEDLLAEIRRQLDLYDPYVIYLKALSLWGQDRQGAPAGEVSRLLGMLDKHQEEGYYQALRILEREHGVMVCDGVGLGKSFIALALMDHFCREGKNVLLIAPKNVLTNSWNGYLGEYLSRYRSPFGNIHEMAMTELGFEPGEEKQVAGRSGNGQTILDDDQVNEPRAEGPEEEGEKLELVRRLAERADVVVVDESHNFRTRSANRYVNLFRILAPLRERKEVILLTATPINTYYTGPELAVSAGHAPAGEHQWGRRGADPAGGGDAGPEPAGAGRERRAGAAARSAGRGYSGPRSATGGDPAEPDDVSRAVAGGGPGAAVPGETWAGVCGVQHWGRQPGIPGGDRPGGPPVPAGRAVL